MMEKHQEKRYMCKLCNKSFLSGKVLGGHMRCHIAKNSANKTEKKLKMSNLDSDGDDEHAGYGLRVNPKKSWKFSGSKVEASEEEEVCKVCGKGFDSMRALFGHMRHHSGRQRKEIQCCKDCGEGFESMRALTAHTRSHSKRFRASDESEDIASQKLFLDTQYSSETMGLVRKKRSRRLRYKITPTSSFSELNESKYVTEYEQEVVEVAICLVMLSRDRGNWGRNSSVTGSSDNNSLSLEVKSPGQKKPIVDNEGGISVFGDDAGSLKISKAKMEKLADCASECKKAYNEKKISELGENESGIASDEEKIVKLEVPIDRFYVGAEHKMPKLGEESAFVVFDAEVEKESPGEMELDVDISEAVELDVAELGSMKSGLNKKARSKACDSGNNMIYDATESEIFADSQKKREHKCRTCKKVFRSYQALGGHQRVHKTTNSCSMVKIEDCEDEVLINKFCKTEDTCKPAKLECFDNSVEQEMGSLTKTGCESKGYMCNICLKVFASGQALGGHKRFHFGKDYETGAEQTRVLKQQLSDICDAFDLTHPVKLEEENGDAEFKSWWVGNEHKHELLVGLIPN